MPDAKPYKSPRTQRHHVLLGAEIAYADGSTPTKHRIKDLSTTGALVDRAGELVPASLLLITVGRLEAIGATVIWVKDDVAGIQFIKPIDPDAARSKSLVSSVTPPTKGMARFVPRTSAVDPGLALNAGWVSGLTNPYRK